MHRKSAGAVLLGAALAVAGCQQRKAEAPVASPTPATAGMNEDQKAIYAFGAVVGQQVGSQVKALRLSPAELETFKKGLQQTMGGGAPEVPLDQYFPKFQALAQTRVAAAQAEERQRSAEFVARAAQEPGAVKTPSGLVFRTTKPGSGPSPKPTDTVRVNYRGTLTDGTEFDASAKHGGPAVFQLNGVIKCWTEGVGRMKVGEQARLVCPAEIAYGEEGRPGIPPGAALVFDVELLGIQPGGAAGAPQGR